MDVLLASPMKFAETGTLVAVATGAVVDEMPRSFQSLMSKSDLVSKSGSNPAGRLTDRGTELDVAHGYWRGVLREFRNHLSIVMARSGELGTALPGAIALQSADCLADIDGSASLMEGLLTWMDAALVPGPQCVCEIGDVLARATQMATTGLRPCVTLSVDSRPAVVRNRGTAVESALAALIIELARGPDPYAPLSPADDDSSAAVNVALSVHSGRGNLRIAVVSDRSRKDSESSWRLPLAKALLSTVSGEVDAIDLPSALAPLIPATLTCPPTCGFEVRFRLQ
jgi:hypothetical protein